MFAFTANDNGVSRGYKINDTEGFRLGKLYLAYTESLLRSATDIFGSFIIACDLKKVVNSAGAINHYLVASSEGSEASSKNALVCINRLLYEEGDYSTSLSGDGSVHFADSTERTYFIREALFTQKRLGALVQLANGASFTVTDVAKFRKFGTLIQWLTFKKPARYQQTRVSTYTFDGENVSVTDKFSDVDLKD